MPCRSAHFLYPTIKGIGVVAMQCRMKDGGSGRDTLQTRGGRGRKPIMDCSDEKAVRSAIEQDRQSVVKAKIAWQLTTGKEASDLIFKRFLSALAQDISV
ncbi:MAG: hypothetical protein KA206_07875 [Paludibacter sp.]|nr:hypothetical protein [Paludibacter sp.]